MIAAVVVCGQLSLAVHGPAEFPAPDHQRVVQQAALLQILNQRRRGLIRLPGIDTGSAPAASAC